jgi:hypothetical protein
MATVLDVVTGSLVDLGVNAAGETPVAADADGALAALNDLIDQWATEGLMLPWVTRTEKVLAANDGQYTVGSGGDINIARPVHINDIRLLLTDPTPDFELPLIRLTDEAYAAIPEKALTAPQPTAWYYNPTFSSGLATLDFWPIPTLSTLKAVLYVPTAVTSFSALSTTVSLPPAWARMLRKNLARELAPSYKIQPEPELIRQASESLSAVKRSNVRMSDLSMPAGMVIGGRGRWRDPRNG